MLDAIKTDLHAEALFMILAISILRASFPHAAAQATGNTGFEGMANELARAATTGIWEATSFGAGLYLSSIAALYLVVNGVRRFQAGRY